jgi:phage/plasmid-associated DNA primase
MTTTTPEKPLGDFTRFIGTPFASFVLPILPKDAKLHPDSKVDKANLGRLPGRFYEEHGVWTGMSRWQSHTTTAMHLELWNRWRAKAGMPVPLAIRTNEFPGIDCDVNDPSDMAKIELLIVMALGTGANPPKRTRPNSPRTLFMFRWPPRHSPVRKLALTYIHPDGSKHTVEILGHGQSATLEGPHRSGFDYEWPNGDLPSWGENLPELDGDKAFMFMRHLREWVESKEGYTIHREALPTFSEDREAYEIGAADSPLVARDLATLADAVNAIDINNPRLSDYSSWIALMYGIKGAANGDQDFYLTTVDPWLLQHPGNAERGPEWCQELWNAIKTSSLGADMVFAWARSFGWNDGGEFARSVFASVTTTGNTERSEGEVPADARPSEPRSLPETQEGVAGRFIEPRGDGNGSSSGPEPSARLPPLELGSDVEIAGCVAQVLSREHGEVVSSEGAYWHYAGSHWRRIANHELRRAVHRFDRAPTDRAPVKLSKTHVDSILHEMSAMLEQPEFFADAPVGINCASGFIYFAPDGTPSLLPHDRDHRCRHVLKGAWQTGWPCYPEAVFQILGAGDAELLLPRLLRGVFLNDPDAQEKRQLLAEIAGAAALGYGSKLRQPKAVILEGKTAENGKSQILDLFRGLLPPGAVASITAGKMGDERFLVGLVGRHLNAADELSGADAIASDVFKAIVTGEPVTGRDVYRPAVTFRPVAQNVFATNTLPTFKGGMDRGIQRRLLVVPFNRTIPEDERVENIGLRIAEEESNWLLGWAVAGASCLIRQRGFTVPPSSKAALREWLLSADPVLAWIQACVEEINPKSLDADEAKIKSAEAHRKFVTWAMREGFRENTLPAVNSFVHRLRANRPSIGLKHTRDGNWLTGVRVTSTDEKVDETVLPFPRRR